MPQETQKVFGDRYEIVRHVARGGMAQVYLARDVLLDRLVALKVLFPELSVDQSFVERFRREAKAAANLTHPNIVSVFDWGQGDNTYYIVMEYVDGPTLSALLRQGPLVPERAAAIAASVAAALDFAHKRGVIHRDVKPGNVLIDDRGQVKVADFGIARAAGTSDDLTQTGSVMGTATYFSPEQAQGYAVDARSDVYSLGVVLYEMLTGKPPFSGDNPVSIAYKHVKEDAPHPSQLVPGVPAALDAVVMKAMSKDASMRYQTADDLRLDLLRYGNGQPVLAASAVPATLVNAVGADPTRVQQRVASPAVALPATAVQATPGMGVPAYGGGPGDGSGTGRPKRRRTALYASLAALIVILAAVGGYLYYKSQHGGLFGTSTKTLTVPSNLHGETLSTAKSQLTALGFTNVRSADQASSTVPSGEVISSDPTAGAKIKSNALLTLHVSSGAAQVSVPNVVGLTQSQAEVALQADDFKTTTTFAYSASVADGNVISSNPTEGQKAAQGSTVTITVSKGNQPVTIPSFCSPTCNVSAATAGNQLGTLGLKVVSQQKSSTSVSSGDVISTDPPAGETVPVGSTVTLYVSSGAPTTTVPDLTGDTQAQAQSALSSADLVGSFSYVTVTDSTQSGIVQTWTPETGTSVHQGSTVQVQVGEYSPTSTSTSTTSTTVASTGTSDSGSSYPFRNGGGSGSGSG